MNPRLLAFLSAYRRTLAYGGATLLILGLTFYAGSSWGAKRSVAKAEQAQKESDRAHGAAQQSAALGAASGKQAEQEQQAATALGATTAQDRRELSRRLAALPRSAPAPLPSLPATPVSNELSLTKAALAQAQVVITDQAAELDQAKRVDAALIASRDFYKQAYEQDEKALLAQSQATAAYRQAMASASTRSGLKGFALGIVAGVALGYAAHK